MEKFLNELKSLSDKKARVPLQKGVKSHTAFTEECHSLAAELADVAAYYLRHCGACEQRRLLFVYLHTNVTAGPGGEKRM